MTEKLFVDGRMYVRTYRQTSRPALLGRLGEVDDLMTRDEPDFSPGSSRSGIWPFLSNFWLDLSAGAVGVVNYLQLKVIKLTLVCHHLSDLTV